MPRLICRYGLALFAALILVPLANAFPPLPPIKLPPAHLLPGVPVPYGPLINAAIYSSSPGSVAQALPKHSLKDALKIVREVRTELGDTGHLNLSQSGLKAKNAEEIVAREDRIAHSDKKAKRAKELDDVLGDIHRAQKDISDHRVDDARKALKEAADGLVVLTGGKAPAKDPKKETKKN